MHTTYTFFSLQDTFHHVTSKKRKGKDMNNEPVDKGWVLFAHEITHTPEVERALSEIYTLDPELFEYEDTRKLVELGLQYGEYVTKKYGTPAQPKWASGTHEADIFMSYHNGGETGHTSVGTGGAGVPRNVLVIASTVNTEAGGEIFTPIMRATTLYAAFAHDAHQLCGRSLLPEGQGEDRGDERISAEMAHGVLLDAGFSFEIADQAYKYIMATAFNPHTSSQNVQYGEWNENRSDSIILNSLLGQELIAAADLLSPSLAQGTLGSIAYSVEMMCLHQYGQPLQKRLHEMGVSTSNITTMEQMFALISKDDTLREIFHAKVVGQKAFFADYLHYSDKAIRFVCGKGIDELFAGGRERNVAMLSNYAIALEAGATPLEIWGDARKRAEQG
jgi:hypothetical protein